MVSEVANSPPHESPARAPTHPVSPSELCDFHFEEHLCSLGRTSDCCLACRKIYSLLDAIDFPDTVQHNRLRSCEITAGKRPRDIQLDSTYTESYVSSSMKHAAPQEMTAPHTELARDCRAPVPWLNDGKNNMI